jgi:hypothetical protein
MTFLKFKSQFEESLRKKFDFELTYWDNPIGMEGANMFYKINDKQLRIHYEGRDDFYTVFIAQKGSDAWQELFVANPKELLKNKMEDIFKVISSSV